MSRLPKYEQSFAYHIEVELGLDINKIWNFEKNTVSPYEIFKGCTKKVWLYCLEKDYHNDEGGYEISCNNFYNGSRCSYCNSKGGKVHPKDSFAQWCIDNIDKDFLEKYWSKKNIIDPYTIAPQSNRIKVWILCQEKDYHNDEGGYEIICSNFYEGKRCSYCGKKHKIHKLDSFAQWGIDNIDKDFLKKYWSDKNTLDPYTIAPQSSKKIWILCQEKDYHNDNGGYEVSCDKFYEGNRCSYCASHKIHKKDSFAYLYPQITEMIVADKRNGVTINDLYKIAPTSHKKYYFKCNECGKGSNQKKQIANISLRNFSCEYCSDGISVPEKIMMNILKQLDINYKSQLSKSTFEWCQNYKYDFYIPSLSMIIETHGIQHYDKGFEGCNGRTLEQEQLNDKFKKELALKNNIKEYIIIDCRKSEFDWLKENIEKELNKYFNLLDVDWILAWENSFKSVAWEIKKLIEEDLDNSEIAEILNINKGTVIKYKKQLGIKTRQEIKQENLLKVEELLQQGKTIKEITEILGISRSTVSRYKNIIMS